jgi:hypothetical protein
MPLSYEEEIEIRRETILELASKGWTQQAIAAKLGYSQAQIPKDLAVVREGIEAAGGTTVMISRQSNAKVDLYAKGVLASTQNVNIADINLNFGLAKESYIDTSVIAHAGLMPLFRAWTYKKHPEPVQILYTKRAGRITKRTRKFSRNMSFLQI